MTMSEARNRHTVKAGARAPISHANAEAVQCQHCQGRACQHIQWQGQ